MPSLTRRSVGTRRNGRRSAMGDRHSVAAPIGVRPRGSRIMSETRPFPEHWLNIDPERLARYETMYQWSAAAEAFYAPAGIGAGQVVVDFGCGPGHTAIEFARRVGGAGHVHALDINA